MFNIRLTDDHLFRKWLFTGLSVVMSLMVSYFMLSFTVSFFFYYGFHGNQYKQAGGQKYMADTILFNEHFVKYFVKISEMAWQ